MSTHVVGFKPVDAKWKAMRDVYNACKAAKINLPREVEKFFEDSPPDDNGVRVDLDKHPCVTKWKEDMQGGPRGRSFQPASGREDHPLLQ